jgi:hypothetical protein
VNEISKSFSIKHVIDIIAEAWTEVSEFCMNGVWEKFLPHFVHDFRGFELGEEMETLQEQCIALAK